MQLFQCLSQQTLKHLISLIKVQHEPASLSHCSPNLSKRAFKLVKTCIYLCEQVTSGGCQRLWLPAPPWCQSPLLSHGRRWVAGRCHVHRSSRPKPKRKYIVKVGNSVLQLKLRVSAPAMRSTRLVTERQECGTFSSSVFFWPYQCNTVQ